MIEHVIERIYSKWSNGLPTIFLFSLVFVYLSVSEWRSDQILISGSIFSLGVSIALLVVSSVALFRLFRENKRFFFSILLGNAVGWLIIGTVGFFVTVTGGF